MRFILAATREQADAIARSQVIRTPVPKHYDLAELRTALDGTPSGERLAVKLAPRTCSFRYKRSGQRQLSTELEQEPPGFLLSFHSFLAFA